MAEGSGSLGSTHRERTVSDRQEPAPIRRRSQAIEALRIVAALGVVWFHAGAPHSAVAYAGLIVFLILAPLFDLRDRWAVHQPVSRLARRLLLPWAFWMIAYAVPDLVGGTPLLLERDPLAGILFGTSPHLWFLPFLFGMMVLLGLAKRVLSPAVLGWIGTMGAAALLASAAWWRPPSLEWSVPLPQWIHALPAVLVGVAFGLFPRLGPRAWLAGLALALGLAACVIETVPEVGKVYLCGIGLTAAAVAWPERWWPAALNVQSLSDSMLGVYLIHLFVLEPIAQVTGPGTYLTVALTFAISLALVWTLRRLAPGTRLVLG